MGVNAGCSMLKIRSSGWSDSHSAIALRKLGIDASKMKLGGWALSELGKAGYSTAELRNAGFSAPALAAWHQLQRKQSQSGQRPSTAQARKEGEQPVTN